jgi:hypothetical protein
MIVIISVKVLEKRHIMRERKTQYVMREKEVLMKLNHPFFIRLFFTFQDTDRLCILCTASYLDKKKSWVDSFYTTPPPPPKKKRSYCFAQVSTQLLY